MKKFGAIVAVAVVAGVTGCTNMTPQQRGTGSGAAVGAGPAFGRRVHPWRGPEILCPRLRSAPAHVRSTPA